MWYRNCWRCKKLSIWIDCMTEPERLLEKFPKFGLLVSFSKSRVKRKVLIMWVSGCPDYEEVSIIQFSSVIQSCPTLCDPMNRSTPGLPVHHQLQESTQTHVHWVSDAIQPFHPVIPFSSCLQSFPIQGLFKWVSSSHQVAKVLEFQLQL